MGPKDNNNLKIFKISEKENRIEMQSVSGEWGVGVGERTGSRSVLTHGICEIDDVLGRCFGIFFILLGMS